jgi:hypothetical protein
MKYLKYLSVFFLPVLFLSFAPFGKARKVKPVSKAPFGHVQWVKETPYHAIEDSTGLIFKGDVISDTDDYHDMGARPRYGQPIEMWTYDEYGNETEDAKCHANGNLYFKESHIYNENGDVTEVIDSSFRKQNPVDIQQYNYKYDTSGNVLILNKWSYTASNKSNSTFFRAINIYDSAGKLRKTLTYKTDTINPVSAIWSTYNEKGKLVETDERKRDGNSTDLAPYEKNDYWYDKKGRLIDKATYHPKIGLVKDEKITFDSTGKTTVTYSYAIGKVLTETIVKKFFKATNTTQEDTYDGDGMLTDYTISHDSAKHVMDKGVFHVSYKMSTGADNKIHNHPPGDTVMVHHIINDNHFNTVVDDNFSNDGTPTSQQSYQYTYDSVGNWIGKVQYTNNKAVKIIEREIGYFKE